MMMSKVKPCLNSTEDIIDPRIIEEDIANAIVEKLFEILVDESEPTRVLHMGSKLNGQVVEELVNFMKENQDFFSWTHDDIVGISLEIICHRLNIDLEKRLVSKKKASHGSKML